MIRQLKSNKPFPCENQGLMILYSTSQDTETDAAFSKRLECMIPLN